MKLYHHTAPAAREAPQRLQRGAGDVPLSRAQLARNQRHRARTAAAAAETQREAAAEAAAADGGAAARAGRDDSDNSDSDDDAAAGHRLPDAEKMGAKKRAKLEAKADKRAHREAEQQHRDDRKKRDELAADERRQAEERERQAEQRQEEAERAARELRERQEHEEYVRMRAAFSVEEEGYDETAADGAEGENLLQQFVEHIRAKKVVLLEDLARTFKLKTQAAIDRIQELKANGTLTGVLDDRGKFIYISEQELRAVATFIRQRGRISIGELAESSNNLISLAPAAEEAVA